MGNAIEPERSPMVAKISIDIDKFELPHDDRKLFREILRKDNTIYRDWPKKASGEGRYLWHLIVYDTSPKYISNTGLNGNAKKRITRAKEIYALAIRVNKLMWELRKDL